MRFSLPMIFFQNSNPRFMYEFGVHFSSTDVTHREDKQYFTTEPYLLQFSVGGGWSSWKRLTLPELYIQDRKWSNLASAAWTQLCNQDKYFRRVSRLDWAQFKRLIRN